MAYLANRTRISSLTINGSDYTSSLISWQVSDQSAFKNGCITTTGSVVLGEYAGGPLIEDYDRDNFKRGATVILDIEEPGGASYRHPRGYLYVISTSYDIEGPSLTVEVGCQLALAALTDEVDSLLSIVPVTLDTAQKNFENISAAFASVGQYVYQDNQGNLQTGEYFDGDTTSGVASGSWISVLGITALSVRPLTGSGAIPDRINLSYQVPVDSIASDQKGKVDTETTESYYFTRYPAVNYVRINGDATAGSPNGTLGNIGGTATYRPTSGASSSCGNTPAKPADNGTPSCNEGYELKQEPLFLPAYRIDTTTTYYDGPAGQVSKTYQEVRGPAIEANQQYYADKFAYCRSTWATNCQPNGGCPYEGMDQIFLASTETINYFGEANELVKTIVDNYATTLSAAQPSDWRSGVVNGIPQDFNDNLSLTDKYRTSRTETVYRKENNANIQETTTYNSISTRSSGISGVDLDALKGIRTFQRRTSTSNTTLDVAPDLVNSATTDTKEETSTIILFSGRYKEPPDESGPLIQEEQIPMPLLFENRTDIDNAVVKYENYIERFIKGDAFGLQIGESMRSDIVSGWTPNMPFRYYDTQKDRVLAMRMDATSWGVTPTESALVTNGMWIGFSDGSITIPENLVGNSSPDMGSGTTPAPTPVPPSIDSETSVDSGSFAWQVDVQFMLQYNVVTYGADGVVPQLPSDLTTNLNWTFTAWVEGLIVQAGDVLATDPDGSIPLDFNGSLIVTDATVVDSDVFVA